MVKFLSSFLGTAFCLVCICGTCEAQTAKSVSTERFFGLHYDFHATLNDRGIGRTLTAQDVDSVLSAIRPDYIQVDTKGHPGISSYPTKIGVSAPNILVDPLKIFRAETYKYHTALYSHFSGVVDAEAVKDHPQWASLDERGHPNSQATSLFSSYKNTYFIPQIKELIDNYHIDGVWVDGECWAVQQDYSKAAIASFMKLNNRTFKNDSTFSYGQHNRYTSFLRQSYHKYLADYVNQLHNYKPTFKVASNWAFSAYMPGPLDARVDFLSGDLSSSSFTEAELESHFMSGYHKPWDLIVWASTYKTYQSKSLIQIKQEISPVLAEGGGVGVYTFQKRDAALPLGNVQELKAIKQFCVDRKPYCFKTTSIPQVGLFFSNSGYERMNTHNIFSTLNTATDNVKGMLNLLLNAQYSVDIIQDFQASQLNSYPVIVIADWDYLPATTIAQIKQYITQGGKVLVTGKQMANAFAALNNIATLVQVPGITPGSTAGELSVKKYGKGLLAVLNNDVSATYLGNLSPDVKSDVSRIIDALMPNKMVVVKNSENVHISTRKKGNDILIQLVNATGQKVNVPTSVYNSVAPITTLNLSVKLAQKPTTVTLEPQHKQIPFQWNGSAINVSIDKLDLYDILKIAYK
ncbi:hypothetical protein GCM10027037_35320 [Mucilaginibacter koreensis]